ETGDPGEGDRGPAPRGREVPPGACGQAAGGGGRDDSWKERGRPGSEPSRARGGPAATPPYFGGLLHSFPLWGTRFASPQPLPGLYWSSTPLSSDSSPALAVTALLFDDFELLATLTDLVLFETFATWTTFVTVCAAVFA